jgi:hypothetical protein
MTKIMFDIKDIQTVADDLAAAKALRPMADQIFDPTIYLDGKIVDKHGQTEEESNDPLWWPDAEQIPKEKVPPCYALVGDQGVYLMNNREFSPGQKQAVVAYAYGCNPQKDPDFYENKRRLFGGDDGAVAIPAAWIDHAIQKGASKLFLNLTEDRVSYDLGFPPPRRSKGTDHSR